MTWLLEDPTPALVGGAVLTTLAAIVYTSLRTTWSLIALAAAILIGAAGVALEVVVQTPREQAENALVGLLDDVKANDLTAVLARLAPGESSVRADAERLMPEFEIEKANLVGSMTVTLDDAAAPTRAEVKCRVFVSGKHRRSGARGGLPPQELPEVTFLFVRSGDRWLLEDYSGANKWRRGAAELRSKR